MTRRKRKVIVCLTGGLGNQLFMYAAARALAIKLEATLYIDNITGFKNDRIFKRKFQLEHYNIEWKKAPRIYSFNFWGGRIVGRVSEIIGFNLLVPSIKILMDFNHLLINDVIFPHYNNYYLNGYWQSSIYFKEFETILKKDLIINDTLSKYTQDILNQILSNDVTSIAIGVRRYDEVPPSIQIRGVHYVENVHFYNKSIDYYKNKYNNAHFFIFTQAEEWVLENIIANDPKYFTLVSSKKASSTVQDLYLFSQCKHFIIANSTLYWWGAWMSGNNNKEVISSKFFPNNKTVVEGWMTF
jgi:hypothetical protein